MEENVTVKHLLEKLFSVQSLQEKLEVVRKEHTRHFSVWQYESVDCLMGRPDLNKLFCWPGLLFSKEESAWNNTCFQIKNILPHQHNISQLIEQVNRNREIMKKLIDAVCYLAKQELPLRGHSESDASANKGNYLEFRNYLEELPQLFKMKLLKQFLKLSRNRFSRLCSRYARKTSDILCKSQLSIVLRYVHEGNVNKDSLFYQCQFRQNC
ncbi:hypothetical protein PR048_031543 [Dryococelus australis]|uniref:DUF4371 domain-containing protein n=1 Tax=Dryococelus australis TaxID=614101 RepID=A0ABQ9G5K3_9NEOP|nr:hypothetical protein PR048_031543 [Dryococelus australis]